MHRKRIVSSALCASLLAGLAAPAESISGMIASRQKFFGAANVDTAGAVRSDKVILSWFSTASFAMAIDGHVVFLDAYIDPGAGVPTTYEQLAELQPEAIFLGHAHFDHAGGVPDILRLSDSNHQPVVLGTPEQCDTIAANMDSGVSLNCVGVVPRDPNDVNFPSGNFGGHPADEGLTVQVSQLSGVSITAIKHQHTGGGTATGLAGIADMISSNVNPTDPVYPWIGCVPWVQNGGINSPFFSQQTPLSRNTDPGWTHQDDPWPESWSLLWRFQVRDFSLVYFDTRVQNPEDNIPNALTAMDGLPASTVAVGIGGFLDPMRYLVHLRPSIYVPAHHDFSNGPASCWKIPTDLQMAQYPPEQRPQVRFIEDPEDYVNPTKLTFDVPDTSG